MNASSEPKSGIGVGSASLILIFVVLCLAVFSLLTLNTAKGENELAEKTAASIAAYYQADAQAEILLSEIRAHLFAGENLPDEIDNVTISISATQKDGSYRIAYTLPLGETQLLSVLLRYDPARQNLDIQTWQVMLAAEWQAEDDFSVWDGNIVNEE